MSTSGSDSASGSESSPWRTVGKAVSWAVAGDTVYFRGGQYNERLLTVRSGGNGNPISFKNYPGETPILDGSGQSFNYEAGMVEIRNKSNIVVEGFELRDLTTSVQDKTPIGVLVYGDYYTSGPAPDNITIRNCRIHRIRNNHGSEGNAHGILVRGETTSTMNNIVLEGNEVYDNTLGWSEAVAINGNVDGFSVVGNTVRDNNNIGIDAIGYESAYPANNPLNSDESLNRARNGLIAGNLVYNCTTTTNPNYGNSPSAGGIYVDGGTDILIDRNRVFGCDIGIEIASEASGRYSSNCTVRNNVLHHNRMSGLLTGGYAGNVGGTQNCVATNNTIYRNNTLNYSIAEVLVRRYTHGLILKNNTIVANSQAVMVGNDSSQTSGLSFDYNCYFAAGGANNSHWQWDGTGTSDFSAWKNTSGQDIHSTWGDPQFANTSGTGLSLDFNLAANSPAIDAGDPGFSAAPDETDFAGNPRVEGPAVDAGAYEYPVPLTGIASWRLLHFNTTENAGEAANNENPDMDAGNNAVEYAFGVDNDPKVAGVNGLPSFGRNAAGGFEVMFTRNPEAIDTTYKVRATSSLGGGWPGSIAERLPGGSWSSIPGVSVTDSSGSVILTDSRNIDGQCYYRVDAIIPE